MVDLSNIDELKQACADVVENAPTDSGYVQWGNDLREFLAEVRAADLQDTCERKRSSGGSGTTTLFLPLGRDTFKVDAAIEDPEFRNWLAERSMEDLCRTRSNAGRRRWTKLYDELEEKVCQYTNSTPRLKIYRVLAGFFPLDFTTVAFIDRMKGLHAAMFGNRGGAGPSCHAKILRRLDEVQRAGAGRR